VKQSRNFKEKREYLKNKMYKLATNSKNADIRNLYRGIKSFKMGYQPRSNLVKNENGVLLADSHNIYKLLLSYGMCIASAMLGREKYKPAEPLAPNLF
jgi:hypothetical protein